jgi:[CysO sulfur-carrier protein]-S-L-cysteine hydrolase
VIVTPDEIDAIRRHAVHAYPEEACGVIVERGGERRHLACRNIQNELHARDPVRHPRDARTAYYIDPRDLLAIGRLDGDGFRVAVIYHSHVDAGAYFSATDRRQALVGGEPIYPAAAYVVASVVGGQVAAVAAFRWDAGLRDFVPADLEGTAVQPGGPQR